MTDLAVIEWRTPELVGQLAGWKEAAEIMGRSHVTLHRWLRPGTGPHGPTGTFLIEPAMIAAGPVWFRCDLERFRLELDAGPARATRPAKSLH